MHAHGGQQRAQRPGTALGTTINIVTVVDGKARTWLRHGGKRIGPITPLSALLYYILSILKELYYEVE